MSVTPSLECLELHEYQYITVGAGATEFIIDYAVAGGFTAFIEKIACDLPYEETTSGAIAKMYHEFIVDGTPTKIKYEIPINKPREYNPPIVAMSTIKWRFYNADSKAHVIGVLIAGRLCKPILVHSSGDT